MHQALIETGKHRGKPYYKVRIENPEYFVWLVQQPAGNVVKHFNFIKYCLNQMVMGRFRPDPMVTTKNV